MATFDLVTISDVCIQSPQMKSVNKDPISKYQYNERDDTILQKLTDVTRTTTTTTTTTSSSRRRTFVLVSHPDSELMHCIIDQLPKPVRIIWIYYPSSFSSSFQSSMSSNSHRRHHHQHRHRHRHDEKRIIKSIHRRHQKKKNQDGTDNNLVEIYCIPFQPIDTNNGTMIHQSAKQCVEQLIKVFRTTTPTSLSSSSAAASSSSVPFEKKIGKVFIDGNNDHNDDIETDTIDGILFNSYTAPRPVGQRYTRSTNISTKTSTGKQMTSSSSSSSSSSLSLQNNQEVDNVDIKNADMDRFWACNMAQYKVLSHAILLHYLLYLDSSSTSSKILSSNVRIFFVGSEAARGLPKMGIPIPNFASAKRKRTISVPSMDNTNVASGSDDYDNKNENKKVNDVEEEKENDDDYDDDDDDDDVDYYSRQTIRSYLQGNCKYDSSTSSSDNLSSSSSASLNHPFYTNYNEYNRDCYSWEESYSSIHAILVLYCQALSKKKLGKQRYNTSSSILSKETQSDDYYFGIISPGMTQESLNPFKTISILPPPSPPKPPILSRPFLSSYQSNHMQQQQQLQQQVFHSSTKPPSSSSSLLLSLILVFNKCSSLIRKVIQFVVFFIRYVFHVGTYVITSYIGNVLLFSIYRYVLYYTLLQRVEIAKSNKNAASIFVHALMNENIDIEDNKDTDKINYDYYDNKNKNDSNNNNNTTASSTTTTLQTKWDEMFPQTGTFVGAKSGTGGPIGNQNNLMKKLLIMIPKNNDQRRKTIHGMEKQTKTTTTTTTIKSTTMEDVVTHHDVDDVDHDNDDDNSSMTTLQNLVYETVQEMIGTNTVQPQQQYNGMF